MELTLVRHFPTANNKSDIFIGITDVDCDFEYIQVHKDNHINLFASYYPEDLLLYCSPLSRTIETAGILFPSVSVHTDYRLLERDLGCWNNKSKQSMRKLYPYAFDMNGRLKTSYTPPKGETFENVIRRTLSFIKSISEDNNKNKSIIAITHNGIINAFFLTLAVYNNKTYCTKSFPYATPIVFELSNDYISFIYNSSYHSFL